MSVEFRLVGSEGGTVGHALKYHAVVNGHQLAKEIVTTKDARTVSYYWEESKPVYSDLNECLNNAPMDAP